MRHNILLHRNHFNLIASFQLQSIKSLGHHAVASACSAVDLCKFEGPLAMDGTRLRRRGLSASETDEAELARLQLTHPFALALSQKRRLSHSRCPRTCRSSEDLNRSRRPASSFPSPHCQPLPSDYRASSTLLFARSIDVGLTHPSDQRHP